MSPAATYRIQLRESFGFRDAGAIADYLAQLGVSHIYCSPILQARRGSTHGYDVVDPRRLSEELGGAPGYAEMVSELRAHGLGQVLDIVPNHMAVDWTNPLWRDVLEDGPASVYAPVFDIDWEGGRGDRFHYTVLVPVLGDHYGRVIEARQIAVRRVGGHFEVRYGDVALPVSPRTVDDLLATAARRSGSAELAELAQRHAELPLPRPDDPALAEERHRLKTDLAAEMEELCGRDPAVATAIDGEVTDLNDDPDRLDALLRRQNYRIASWRTANEEIDYRRFFNIESLVGVRVEDPQVFALTHRLILDLVREGTVSGLRVDHVDGLRDPGGYLDRLQQETSGVYTVVEKILEPGERLPAEWPVAGTTGYDFLNRVNNLFVATANEKAVTACYHDMTGESVSYGEVVYAAKQQVMREEFSAEIERLTDTLADISDRHRRQRDHTRRELRHALRELIARYPVYRIYLRNGPASGSRQASAADRDHMGAAAAAVLSSTDDVDRELIELISRLALGDEEGPQEAEFAVRLAQLTGPVMAKGVEDTAFYRYNRLVSLNEVGGDPGTFGRPIESFHADTAAAADGWPESMLTLSTHDTKRSADLRATIDVLSEIPAEWAGAVERCFDLSEPHAESGWPDANTRYLLFQTLVGTGPIDAERLASFVLKAAREAKVYTAWTDPDEGYEDALDAYTRGVVGDPLVMGAVENFVVGNDVARRGHRNSLAQVALLLTCPGVPDLYQGTELWDTSLVDPDNRRSVDYDARRRALDTLPEAVVGLPVDDAAGRAKLWLIRRLLQHRRARPDLYASDLYEPVVVSGRRSDDVVAFRRGALAVAVPCAGGNDWAGTTLALQGRWTDVLSGAETGGAAVAVGELFAAFPVAVLVDAGSSMADPGVSR